MIPFIQITHVEQAVPLAKTLVEDGLSVAEVTFRTEAAVESIRLMREAAESILILYLFDVQVQTYCLQK